MEKKKHSIHIFRLEYVFNVYESNNKDVRCIYFAPAFETPERKEKKNKIQCEKFTKSLVGVVVFSCFLYFHLSLRVINLVFFSYCEWWI